MFGSGENKGGLVLLLSKQGKEHLRLGLALYWIEALGDVFQGLFMVYLDPGRFLEYFFRQMTDICRHGG